MKDSKGGSKMRNLRSVMKSALKRTFVLALPWLLVGGEGHAQVESSTSPIRNVRIVLSDGHVIAFNEEGRRVDGSPPRLDLGGAYGVFEVQADLAKDLLYVTPEHVDNLHTRVFQMSSLRLLGLLPGVANVQIPRQASAPLIGSLGYGAHAGSQLTSVLQVRENAEVLTGQLRNRSRPEEVTARSDEYQATSTDFSCYIAASNAFHYGRADKRITSSFAIEPLAGQEEYGNGIFTFGGCWPDGSVWLKSVVRKNDRAAFNTIRVLGPDLMQVAEFSLSPDYIVGSTRVFALGSSPGALAFLPGAAAGGKSTEVGIVRRVGSKSDRQLAIGKLSNPLADGFEFFPAGQTRDGSCVYLVPTALTDDGAQWDRSDRLFRLCADEASPWVELNLPAELVRINTVSHLRYDETLDEEQRKAALEAVEPVPAELSDIAEVSVMFVIPPAPSSPR